MHATLENRTLGSYQGPSHRIRGAFRDHHHAGHPLDRRRISRRLSRGDDHEETVRSESAKHGQAVASVISSVAISLLYVVVAVDIANQLSLPVGSLVAPAAVLGAAFGLRRAAHGARSAQWALHHHRKQYGFGDLVTLSVNSGGDARGTVEDVTLRVTKLRTGDGEVYTVPRAIVKSLNLSKDWARAVVDIPCL